MKPFLPVALRQADYARQIYRLPAEGGVSIDEILSPAAWAHLDRTLHLYDRIEVVASDGSYFIDLIVTGEYPHFRVAPLMQVALSSGSEPVKVDATPEKAERPTVGVPDGYAISHTPRTKWRVIRAADGDVLVKGLATRDDAVNWLADFLAEEAKADETSSSEDDGA